ncbi:MAG TPA: helix-turn-helix domain-containing protein [Verrucomicrobiae bacterium]|nr:helix-turn-helix domain-containing protein [Verrucomicrobiae bacterium]
MPSPKSNSALAQLGRDLRAARLRRRLAAADLAVRAGVSLSTIGRLEKGDAGVGVGTLADVLVALGLIKRLGELVDIRSDELGLALAAEHTPRRAIKTRKSKTSASKVITGDVDPEGEAF